MRAPSAATIGKDIGTPLGTIQEMPFEARAGKSLFKAHTGDLGSTYKTTQSSGS